MEVSAFKGINPPPADVALQADGFVDSRDDPSRNIPSRAPADALIRHCQLDNPISGVLVRRSRGLRVGSAPAAWAPPAGIREPAIPPVPPTNVTFHPHAGVGPGGGPGVAARAPSCCISRKLISKSSHPTPEGGAHAAGGTVRSPLERPGSSLLDSRKPHSDTRIRPDSSSSAGGGRPPLFPQMGGRKRSVRSAGVRRSRRPSPRPGHGRPGP